MTQYYLFNQTLPLICLQYEYCMGRKPFKLPIILLSKILLYLEHDAYNIFLCTCITSQHVAYISECQPLFTGGKHDCHVFLAHTGNLWSVGILSIFWSLQSLRFCGSMELLMDLFQCQFISPVLHSNFLQCSNFQLHCQK